MAKESMKARERKRIAMVEKYAKKREELKAAGDCQPFALERHPRR